MILIMGFLMIFIACFALITVIMPIRFSGRPTLKLDDVDPAFTFAGMQQPKKKGFWAILSSLAMINKPLTFATPLGRRLAKDLAMAKSPLNPEEFLLVKEVVAVCMGVIVFTFAPINSPQFPIAVLMIPLVGYYVPEFMLKGQIRKVKDSIIRDLPDTVDLLGLCVNAGLDFMMALKYVIEKSANSNMIDELKLMLQEINVGKPRRDALRDLSRKYELPDLSTFSRTLIQADRMGTSVSEALNILSEDMREARFRRGETMAMKAPLKMLIPLLFCIFPVVAILVAGPVFLDFFQNNPIQSLGK